MKHNYTIPNAHFHKQWKLFVKTWFDQPARKKARRVHRAQKAAAIAPRPVNYLRPVVRGQTQRYNGKVRAGRGFTIDELKAGGITKKQALGLGISVDYRRHNRSEDAFNINVNRVKQYKSKLVIFPRKPSSQRVKKGDSSKEELKTAKQVHGETMPLDVEAILKKVKARAVKPAERAASAKNVYRKALTDSKRWGARQKRREEKEAEKAGKAKKAGKEEAAAGGDDE